MTGPRIVQIGATIIHLWPQYMETRFRLIVPAAGNDDAESVKRAAELGYDSTWEMSRDHELIHSLIAEQRGEPCSRVLLGVALRGAGICAKEQIVSPLSSWQEESLVLSVQKYVRLGAVDVLLEASGLDLERLKQRLGEITGE